MSDESQSIAWLRAANPVSVDQAAVRSPQGQALLERIMAEPRGQTDPRHGGVGRRARLTRSRAGVLFGGVGVSVVIVAIIAIALSGSTAEPAFAGWTPTPAMARQQQITAAIRKCGLTGPVLVEVRGPYTAAVFASAAGGTACVVGPSMSFVGSVGGARSYQISPDQIGMAVESNTDSNGHGFILLTGRTGSAVRAVVIHRLHHSDVIATVRHGWYLAWWPASTRATGATVTTSTGREQMSLPPLAKMTLTCSVPTHSGHDGVCGSTYEGNGPGDDGVPGPPLVGNQLGKPFHGLLLFNVWSATSVRVCFHPPANVNVAVQPNGPTGPCVNASLVTRLPHGYPVQQNLLEVFPREVWEIKLPADLRNRSLFPILVIAHNPRFGKATRHELNVHPNTL